MHKFKIILSEEESLHHNLELEDHQLQGLLQEVDQEHQVELLVPLIRTNQGTTLLLDLVCKGLSSQRKKCPNHFRNLQAQYWALLSK